MVTDYKPESEEGGQGSVEDVTELQDLRSEK